MFVMRSFMSVLLSPPNICHIFSIIFSFSSVYTQVALRKEVASYGKRHVCHRPNPVEQAWLQKLADEAGTGTGPNGQPKPLATEKTRKARAKVALNESTERAKVQVGVGLVGWIKDGRDDADVHRRACAYLWLCVCEWSDDHCLHRCSYACFFLILFFLSTSSSSSYTAHPCFFTLFLSLLATQVAALAKRVSEALENRSSGSGLNSSSILMLGDGLEQWKDRLDEVRLSRTQTGLLLLVLLLLLQP